MEYERYKHHDNWVWVRKDLKGKHRDYCLCHCCASFFPEDRKKNCPIANMLYAIDCFADIVTPVWECPLFRPNEYEHGNQGNGQDREGNQIRDTSAPSTEA